MAPTSEELAYAISHIFLPSILPQSDDYASERALFPITIDALTAFRQIVTGVTARDATNRALLTLAKSKAVHGPNGISESALHQALGDLKFSILLHVQAQNAGLIVTKVGTKTNFEQFELSPQNASVFKGAGRLVRTFPASAISITNVNLTPEALSMIAQTLSTLSSQAVSNMQPQSNHECRDSTHPGMISEYFMSLLLPIGASVSVPAITKRTREEVHRTNAKSPFRRSPLWLLIRVTLQIIFSRTTLSSDLYKLFITFLMSQVLGLSLESTATEVQSEVIYLMEATIARRLLKLPEQLITTQGTILESINRTLLESSQQMSERWQAIQSNQTQHLDMSALRTLEFEHDALVSIPQLDMHIQSLERRQPTPITADYSPKVELVIYTADQLPVPSQPTGSGTYLTAKLQAFEQWVSDHLTAWFVKHEQDAQTCGKLADLLNAYYTEASVHYTNNPEAFSISVLTALDIWVACDKAAIVACPMLGQYDAGIPVDMLQTLLLPFRTQMARLHEIEKYLRSRCRFAGLKGNSLLYDTSSPESFGAKYFDDSQPHQELHARIKKWASETRTKKIAELATLQAEYRRLTSLIESTVCETKKVFHNPTQAYIIECLATCHRCAHQKQLDALTITFHEWPLPRDLNTAKVVTFELRVPQWYARWRDITHLLLRRVLCGNKTGGTPQARYSLASDAYLAKYFVSAHRITDTGRIGLLSQAKPFAATPWKGDRAGTVQQKNVCVDNSLNYQYFNPSTGTFGNTFTFGDEVSKLSTYQLPPSCRTLQKYLSKSFSMPDGPSPNGVIASQGDCPFDMSLQEYKDLASLPLGHRIQWDSILLQLKTPSIDFKKSETTLFILQCIHQAGPSNDTMLRPAHHTLAESGMAYQMIELLNKSLDGVKENWESSQAVSVFVTIAI